jgi:hypothetical protein
MKVNKLGCVLSSFLLLFCAYFPRGASADVAHDLQLWTPVTLDVPIRGKLRAYMEVGPRIGTDVSHISQLLVRPGAEYRVNEDFSLFAGYLWQTTYPYNTGNSQVLHENRVWEQILLDKDIKRLSIINRTRLEQRFFEGLNGCGNRARHMVKLNYALNKRLYLTTSDELFVNLNSVKDGPQGGIDQNRYFVGLGLKTFKRSRIEAGYQLQYVNRSDEFDDQANHAILIQTFIGLRD